MKNRTADGMSSMKNTPRANNKKTTNYGSGIDRKTIKDPFADSLALFGEKIQWRKA